MVRSNAKNLGGFWLAGLRHGISVMQKRADTDPTSWIYQANMHGTNDPRNLPGWSSCQHGSYLFLAWHRMYVYFFERILRKASTLPTLTLPYWDYTDPTARALPQPYRLPADPNTNFLFILQREPAINAGGTLPAESTSYDDAFSYTNFSAPNPQQHGIGGHLTNPSFGGPTATGPDHVGTLHGKFESVPHDAIHNLVGGRDGGYMAIVELAARDPIFWAHHANIDRLWSKWIALGGGRVDPPSTDTVWQTTPFTFFDENGTCIVMTGSEIMNTVQQLNYKYDDEGTWAPTHPMTQTQTSTPTRPATDASTASRDATPGQTGSGGSGAPRILAEAAPAGVQLTGARQAVPMAIKDDQKSTVLAMAQGNAPTGQVALVLSGLDYEPGAYYTVYLNLADGEKAPSSTSPHFIGVLAPFSAKAHRGGSAGVTIQFDLARVISALTTQKLWKGDQMTVTFVPGAVRRPNAPAQEEVTTAKVTIGRVQIVSAPSAG